MNIIVKIAIKILNLWSLATKARDVRFVTVRMSLKRCLPVVSSAKETRQVVAKRSSNLRHPPPPAAGVPLQVVRDVAAVPDQ
jgi:hypothetical protein